MAERLIEERWIKVKSQCIDRRLDTLRAMADYRSHKVETSPVGTRRRDEQEFAALMWAIAELSGIGDEVRRERMEYEQVKAGAARRAVKRAEAAEALNVRFRVKVDALKAEVHRLSRLAEPSRSAVAVGEAVE